MLSFFPLDILDEIWDVIESVFEGFLAYSFRVIERTRFPIFKFSKENNSVKNVGGVMVLVLCLLSDDALYLYKVS